MPQNCNNLIVITGQTATGKTSAAIKLAKKYDGELLNADSRQVYKHLNIITGKDLKELNASGVPFYLIDIVDPKTRFSSHQYVEAAAPVVRDIWERGRTPVIVGGTYLYIKHLLYGFDIAAPPNEQLRTDLERKTVAELQNMLAPRPTDINDSDWYNPRRLIRRIEIGLGGTQKKGPKQGGVLNPSVSLTFIGYKHTNREALEQAVHKRLISRLNQGAKAEVENLLREGYKSTDPGLQTMGYTQVIKALQGEVSMDRAIKEWAAKEIQYAKRQYTFMKTDARITWLRPAY